MDDLKARNENNAYLALGVAVSVAANLIIDLDLIKASFPLVEELLLMFGNNAQIMQENYRSFIDMLYIQGRISPYVGIALEQIIPHKENLVRLTQVWYDAIKEVPQEKQNSWRALLVLDLVR